VADLPPLVDGQSWQVTPGAYPHSMLLNTAFVRNGQPLVDERDWIGVFVDGELRGVARPQFIPALNQYRVFIVTHGGIEPRETLEFKIFDADQQTVLEVPATLDFQPEQIRGSVAAPLLFDLAADKDSLPSAFYLAQNRPNPFNANTQISYQLPQDGEVSLVIYNVLGQPIRTLHKGHHAAGFHQVVWDGRNDHGQAVASGLYIYRLESGTQSLIRRLMLLK
jgi:hypothetical protein